MKDTTLFETWHTKGYSFNVYGVNSFYIVKCIEAPKPEYLGWLKEPESEYETLSGAAYGVMVWLTARNKRTT